MGLAELLLGKANPISQFIDSRQNTIGAYGAGLAAGPNFQQGLSNAVQYGAQAAPLDQAAAEKRRQKEADAAAMNKTVEYLRSQPGGAQFADAIENGGVDGSTAFKAWFEETRPKRPDEMKNPYMSAGDGQFFNWQTKEFVGDPNAPPGGGGDSPSTVREWEYFNTLSEADKAKFIMLKRANPALDLGTEYVFNDQLNPGKTLGAPIVKDNFTPAYDKGMGGAQAATDAENVAAVGSLQSKMPGLQKVVADLAVLGEKATYTMAGQAWDETVKQFGGKPSDAAVARSSYIAMVDNQVLPLLRDTFGSAFTVKEGETLRATLGDPNKHPDEKKAVLDAFIAQKMRDVEAMQSRIPGAPGGDVENLVNKWLTQ